MAVPVVTPGRRRRRLWPYAFIVLILGSAIAVGGWRGWLESRSSGVSPPRSDRSSVGPPLSQTQTQSADTGGLLVASGENRSRHRFRPPLQDRAAILVDASTGKVVWAKSAHRRLPIASLTKIMTALIAREALQNEQVVTVARGVPHVEPFREGLRVGERVPVWKLYYGLLLFSGNDDARALAFATAGSERAFVRVMNRRARELGLRDTRFSNSSGAIDQGNYSSAWDLAGLTRIVLRDPFLRAVVKTERKRVRWSPPTFSKIYVNKNRLLTSYRGADGVKTGWTTKAQHCLIASARRRGVHLIAVVLGSWDSITDATRLLNYGFTSR